MKLKQKFPSWCCPYCGKDVGWIGRAFAWLVGTGVHGCDYSNTEPDHWECVNGGYPCLMCLKAGRCLEGQPSGETK